MRKMILVLLTLGVIFVTAQDFTPWKIKIDNLSTFEKNVLINKGTERAFSRKYVHSK